jgi:phosphomannomutase
LDRTAGPNLPALKAEVLKYAGRNLEEIMQADRVEVSWEPKKSKWLVRIESGEEVIRRYCDLPQNADEAALRSAAQQTVQDEGYQLDGNSISIKR